MSDEPYDDDIEDPALDEEIVGLEDDDLEDLDDDEYSGEDDDAY